MAKIEIDIEEYVALLKEKHSSEVAKLEADHKDCYLYLAYCQKRSCEGKVKLGSGGGKGKCDECGTIWTLATGTE